MWFDSHCHLYELDALDDPDADPLGEVLRRAEAAGVGNILVPGTDRATSEHAIRLAGKPGVWAAAAFHPTSVKGWTDDWADQIDELLEKDVVRAVGETGLDHYWDTTYNEDQERAFLAHLSLSKKHDKALVIHTRDSLEAVLELLERNGAPDRTIFHCWSGDTETQMDRALALGAYLSFAGNVSFKNAPLLREAAARVPAHRILVETDAPYLAPMPKRGKRNEPAFVAFVGEAVAAARGQSPDEVAQMTDRNAREVFGIPAG